MKNSAAFWFLAPALGLIAVFFLLPIAAALLLSLTDFDIYAIGDPSALRWGHQWRKYRNR